MGSKAVALRVSTLPIMDGERKAGVKPDGFQTERHGLLGENAQDIAVFGDGAPGDVNPTRVKRSGYGVIGQNCLRAFLINKLLN